MIGWVWVGVVGSAHTLVGGGVDDDSSRGLLTLGPVVLLFFLVDLVLVLIVELSDVVEDDEDTTDLEEPNDDKDDDNHNADDIKALLTEPVFDVAEFTVCAVDALIDVVRVAVEEGPDKEDTKGDVDEGVDSNGVSIGDDPAADFEDRSNETKQ